jgi:hypothetical protein
MFSWNQDWILIEYLLAKIQKLQIAGCTDNDKLVACIWKGLRDAPWLFLTIADKKDSSLAIFCQYLQDIQEVESEEYQKYNYFEKKALEQKRPPADKDNNRQEYKPYLAKTDNSDSRLLKPCWYYIKYRISEKDSIY